MNGIYYIKDTGCQTLLYYIHKGSYPMPQGNEIRYGKRVLVNLHAENLDYLLKDKIVDFPIKCEILDDYRLSVIDERIPHEFLFDQNKIDFLDEFVSTNPLNCKVIATYETGICYCPYIPILKEKV